MVTYKDRITGHYCEEKGFASAALDFLYGESWVSRTIGHCCARMAASSSLLSSLIGWWYRSSMSRRLIKPFIDSFEVDRREFEEPADSFRNFNSFFTRHLKREMRPISPGDDVAIIPADGRYLFYPNLSALNSWTIKKRSFALSELVGDEELASRYQEGTMAIARLCPADYHRFHFPCDCLASPPRLLNGYLHSVHPTALRRNGAILVSNKRFLTVLETPNFGRILYIEIGALGVGSVVQSYRPETAQEKGAEKGYFQFGGSCLILLFEPGLFVFDPDLIAGESHIEVRCLMGQSMGRQSR